MAARLFVRTKGPYYTSIGKTLYTGYYYTSEQEDCIQNVVCIYRYRCLGIHIQGIVPSVHVLSRIAAWCPKSYKNKVDKVLEDRPIII
jgi:hypothetical protein